MMMAHREWHDRDRMQLIADEERLPGGPEDRLTAELARYLFDAGLSPLTKPLSRGLQRNCRTPKRASTSRRSSIHPPALAPTSSQTSRRCSTPSGGSAQARTQ